MKLNNFKAIALAAMIIAGSAPLQAQASNDGGQKAVVEGLVQINPTTVELRLGNGQRVTLDFYGDNIFRMTICVTVVLKVLAKVEILVPSYGFCQIPPCEEFADNVCDEFFSLPIFPPASLCNDGTLQANNVTCTIPGANGTLGTSTTGCGSGCNNCSCRR